MLNHKSQFGDLNKLKISVKGFDITESLVTVNIFQDIFNPVWQATIVVNDTVNSMTKNAYAPEDPVRIELETKQDTEYDGKYTIELVVNEISDRLQQGSNNVTYSIHCVGKAIIQAQRQKLCKAYKNKKASDIVREIVSSIGSNVGGNLSNSSDEQFTWIAPNITPMNALGYMLGIASKDGNADFVLYTQDSSKQQMTFGSLQKMWVKEPKITFVQRPNFISNKGDQTRNKNNEFSHFVIDHFNHVNNIASGMHGVSLCTFNLMTKQWSPASNSPVIQFKPKNDKMFDEPSIYDSVDSWWVSRRKELFKSNQNLIKIQTPGHTKSFEWLGNTVKIDLPSNDSEEPEQLDKKYKGKYMVVAIGHIISRDSYYINIELANGWDK